MWFNLYLLFLTPGLASTQQFRSLFGLWRQVLTSRAIHEAVTIICPPALAVTVIFGRDSRAILAKACLIIIVLPRGRVSFEAFI